MGIAEFENKLREYEDAGGPRQNESERKADLLAILPAELRENLLGKAADDGSYDSFRNMAQAQASKILLTRRRLPLHQIGDEAEAMNEMLNSGDYEEVLAFVNRKF